MKQFTVKWFAAYRDATGVEQEQVQSTAGSPAELFAHMTERHADLGQYSRALVAINDQMASWEATLKGDEQVLFFPPVGGG
jgi:molybdopterin converting factor small subunit